MYFGFHVFIFAEIQPFHLLPASIPCDVSKGTSICVFYCMYFLFQGDYGCPLVAGNRLVGM